jgi:hypothetical protein
LVARPSGFCRRGARRISAFSLLVCACLLSPSVAAAAVPEHPFLETFGGTEQPSFLNPLGLAVDQESHDLYVADLGVSEVQSVVVSATAGQFRLKFGGSTTGDLPFSASAEAVQVALRGLTSVGSPNVEVSGGPGDATGSAPYLVTFRRQLETTDVEQLVCENGTTPLSGGSGCSETTTIPGISSTVQRFNADGTPDDFAALSTNVLDNLVFSLSAKEMQVALDNSGSATDGDVYVAQAGKRVVSIFAPDGSTLAPLTESSEGLFGAPAGVGIDESGALYVGEFSVSDAVHKYVPSANPVVKGDNTANFTSLSGASSPGTLAAGAGPSGGAIFVSRFNGDLFKLDSVTGELKYQITTGVTTVSVDPVGGHLYAAKGSEVVEYDASGESAVLVSETHLPSTVQGIAVDGASGNLYVARAGNSQIEVFGPAATLPEAITDAAGEVGFTDATLNGTVNPKGVPLTECFFEWGETESYGEVAPCEEPDAGEVGNGTSPVAVHVEVSGLSPGTTYHFRLIAENEEGLDEGDDEELLTLGPLVRGTSVSGITAAGATIGGEINPRGEATDFEVEYVTQALFDEGGYAEAENAPIPPQQLGEGSEFIPVAQPLSGLEPDTTYHFRLVASSALATNEGPDSTFSTFTQAVTQLPDFRAYELVSPAQKAGEVFVPYPTRSLGGSCNDCLPGVSEQMTPMQSAPDGEAVLYLGQPFSEGLASGPNTYLAGHSSNGWGSNSLSPPEFASGRGNSGQGYQAFAKDLSRGIVAQVEPALSPEAPSRAGKAFANLYLQEDGRAPQPLVTQEPPNREAGFDTDRFRAIYAAANAGTALTAPFDHVVFEVNDALTGATANAPAALDGGVAFDGFGRPVNLNLYEHFEGQLRLVNVAPGNLETTPGAVLGSGRLLAPKPQVEAVDVDHAVSDDGSRIFWSDEATGRLFVRIEGKETVEIDDPGIFLTASADGSKVLLSDGCLYDLQSEECEDLTLDQAEVHQGGFEGILGTAEDLSRIYFVDSKALSGEGEENANGEHAEDAKPNLYAWTEGTTNFIGQLREGDNKLGTVGELGDWKPSPTGRTAQVSEDGRFLAFMSRARLTGYDNETEGSACGTNECYEVFEYLADPGTLVCASCNPSGQKPIAPSNLSLIRGDPGFPPLRQPDNLSAEGEGRLFFESQDRLSPQDSNGRIQDIYEWEPQGVGSCERTGGCINLISSGHSANDSMFLDSSADGKDVFFVTREQLVPGDTDELLDLYDARAPHTLGESVGFPEGEPVCGGEGCLPPVAGNPPSPTPESSAFQGPGNPPKAGKPKPHKKKHQHKKKKHKRSPKHKRGGAK